MEMSGHGVTSQILRTESTGNTVIFRPAKVSEENDVLIVDSKLKQEPGQKTLSSHHLDYKTYMQNHIFGKDSNCSIRNHTVPACTDTIAVLVITWRFCIFHPENVQEHLCVESMCLPQSYRVIRLIIDVAVFSIISYHQCRLIFLSFLLLVNKSFCARGHVCVCMYIRVQTHFSVSQICIIPLSVFSTVLAEKENVGVCESNLISPAPQFLRTNHTP